MDYFSRWGSDQLAKTAVWSMQALYAEDQLRQRTAWALSQIFVMAVVGGNYAGHTEMWLNYYDIFVRNAFGTYRDVLREVDYFKTCRVRMRFSVFIFSFSILMKGQSSTGNMYLVLLRWLVPQERSSSLFLGDLQSYHGRLFDLQEKSCLRWEQQLSRRELCSRDHAALLHRSLEIEPRRDAEEGQRRVAWFECRAFFCCKRAPVRLCLGKLRTLDDVSFFSRWSRFWGCVTCCWGWIFLHTAMNTSWILLESSQACLWLWRFLQRMDVWSSLSIWCLSMLLRCIENTFGRRWS